MDTSCQKEFFVVGHNNDQVVNILPSVTIAKQEYLHLTRTAAYWKGQHKQATLREESLKKIIEEQKAKIRDLNKRLFGKKSEKKSSGKKKVSIKSQLLCVPEVNNLAAKGTGVHFTLICLLLKSQLILLLFRRAQTAAHLTSSTIVRSQK